MCLYSVLHLPRLRPGQTSPAWVTPVCSLSTSHRHAILANGPVCRCTDTRIRSLEPRNSLSGQDVILPAIQVHQGSGPSKGLRSLEPAVATMHYAPREASYNVRAQPPTHLWFPFRVACKSLLMTGRPCLAEWATDQIPRRATCSTLSTNQACVPPSYELACVSNRRVLVRGTCDSSGASPIYVRLRAPRLLRPSFESPGAMGPSKLTCVSTTERFNPCCHLR